MRNFSAFSILDGSIFPRLFIPKPSPNFHSNFSPKSVKFSGILSWLPRRWHGFISILNFSIMWTFSIRSWALEARGPPFDPLLGDTSSFDFSEREKYSVWLRCFNNWKNCWKTIASSLPLDFLGILLGNLSLKFFFFLNKFNLLLDAFGNLRALWRPFMGFSLFKFPSSSEIECWEKSCSWLFNYFGRISLAW